jgi:folate-binding protein YgfZ
MNDRAFRFGPAESREVVGLLGEDRTRFLHGYVTADVKGLAAGAGTYAFVPTPQGKVRCDAVILALEDQLWIDLPAGFGAGVVEHLAKYVIADRVEITAPKPMIRRAVFGIPDGAVGLTPSDPWSHAEVTLDGSVGRWARDPRRGIADAGSFWVGAAVPFTPSIDVDEGMLEAARVEAGIAAFGIDFDSSRFPQETGAEAEAVSYTKGCYLGQEIIARLHYRGQAQNVLRGLRFAALPLAGSAVVHDGREAGRATSVANSSRFGAIGLAVLHRRVEPGAQVEVEGGGTAEVVALPFGPRG